MQTQMPSEWKASCSHLEERKWVEIPRNSLGESCRGIASRRLTPNIAGAAGPGAGRHSRVVLCPRLGGALPHSVLFFFSASWIHVTCSELFSLLKAPCGKMKRKLLSLSPPPTCFTQWQSRTYFRSFPVTASMLSLHTPGGQAESPATRACPGQVPPRQDPTHKSSVEGHRWCKLSPASTLLHWLLLMQTLRTILSGTRWETSEEITT